METGLIALMCLILWGPAVLYGGWRVVKVFSAPKGKEQYVPADLANQR